MRKIITATDILFIAAFASVILAIPLMFTRYEAVPYFLLAFAALVSAGFQIQIALSEKNTKKRRGRRVN